jgi:E3 ubiquitin-protein ligase RGLG
MDFMFKLLKKKTKATAHTDYESIDQLDEDMNRNGVVEDLRVMVFIDRTSSCRTTGRRSFGGKNLHDPSVAGGNPFQQTIRTLNHLLKFTQDPTFPVYAYGSDTARKFENHLHFLGLCKNAKDVERVYLDTNDISDQAKPTCFRYILNEAMRVSTQTGYYYVVLIITDGSPDPDYRKDDVDAIYEAMNFPLSIAVVGVGDGPFDFMEQLDNMDLKSIGLDSKHIKELKGKEGRFDNLQFVNLYEEVMKDTNDMQQAEENAYFKIFTEVPRQYKFLKERKNPYRSPTGSTKPYPADKIIEEHKRLNIALPFGFEDIQRAPAYTHDAPHEPHAPPYQPEKMYHQV